MRITLRGGLGGGALLALAAVLVLALLLSPGSTHAATTRHHRTHRLGHAAAVSGLPKIGHVFIIVEENESASTTFGPDSDAPYLAKTLRSQGAYLPNYYATGHNSNDNYISMISGQPPNVLNQADCPSFVNMSPGTVAADGVASGVGCVYPSDVQTIAGQLTKAGLSWRDYNDSMGSDPTREPAECAHPAIGAVDHTQTETATDQYATRHDPFVYFHSIIDDTAYCDQHVVNTDPLAHDLSSASLTPNYVFITPGLCDDGHDAKCANGGPGGLTGVNDYLEKIVPEITSSAAFKQQNGLLIITFDEAATSDSSSCCGEIPGPGSPLPGESGKGGGDVGAVLLSPCIQPGTVSQQDYNHYAMLRSVEDIFGLPHLAYAQLPGETSFGKDVFTRNCSQTPTVSVAGAVLPGARAVRLTWKAAGTVAASAYRVQVARGRGGFRTLRGSTTATTLTYPVRRGATYAFRVRGTGWNGAGGYRTIHVRVRR